MSTTKPDVDRILNAIPHMKRGPGGVVAVLKDGEVVGQKTWGYADLDQRIRMTPQTQFPICSISKQMVCLVMESLLQKPSARMLEKKEDAAKQFDDELKRMLPHLAAHEDGDKLNVTALSNMQSGIRDYWAMTTLWGGRPDSPFSILHDAPKALDRIKSFHFSPGSEFSYSNVNFHILGRIMENVAGHSLAQLLTERLFIPAGMSNAALCPNTVGLPLPICGYEGNESVGYFKSTNRIEWAGDAGIAASLEDMIAYEKYLDRSLSDPNSLYMKASQQQKFSDGKNADYGFGFGRSDVAGRTAIRHGGALRGFRHDRMQIPSERISVLAFFNHEASPGAATDYVAKKMLGFEDAETEVHTAAAEWEGDFLDEDTQLYVTVKNGEKPGTLSVRYAAKAQTVKLTSATEASSDSMKIKIEKDTLHATRMDDNRVLNATRIPKPTDDQLHQAATSEWAGAYRCEESDSKFTCTSDDGALYGSFDGFLGSGPMWLMRYIGEDVWALGNPRGMDATPPGDWTVVFKRGAGNKVEGCTVGCWLARNVVYTKA